MNKKLSCLIFGLILMQLITVSASKTEYIYTDDIDDVYLLDSLNMEEMNGTLPLIDDKIIDVQCCIVEIDRIRIVTRGNLKDDNLNQNITFIVAIYNEELNITQFITITNGISNLIEGVEELQNVADFISGSWFGTYVCEELNETVILTPFNFNVRNNTLTINAGDNINFTHGEIMVTSFRLVVNNDTLALHVDKPTELIYNPTFNYKEHVTLGFFEKLQEDIKNVENFFTKNSYNILYLICAFILLTVIIVSIKRKGFIEREEVYKGRDK